MKRLLRSCGLAALSLSLGTGLLRGQTEAGREEVLTVLDRLFDGMRAGDGELVGSLFHEDASLIATGERDGVPFVRTSPIEGFVQAVGNHDGEWDERYWDAEVRIDGTLASVWTTYAFYLNGAFSHCGVDAFLLARTAEGWKIVSLADTRRRDGCPEPPADAR